MSSYQDILHIRIGGQSNPENADNIARDVIRIILQHEPSGILIDVTQLEGRLSPAETFFHVQSYPTNIPRYKTAVFDDRKNSSFGDFFELAATNRGHNIRYFYDRAAALEWLGTSETLNCADSA